MPIDVFPAVGTPTPVVPGVFVCTSSTHPSSPSVGLHIYETNTNTELVWTGSLWQPINVIYNASSVSSWSLTANTYTDVVGISLTLPAGKWWVQAKFGVDTSTSAADRYTARLYDSTNAVDMDSGFVYASVNMGAFVPLASGISLAASAVIKLQAKPDVVQGAQFVQTAGTRIWAIPATALL